MPQPEPVTVKVCDSSAGKYVIIRSERLDRTWVVCRNGFEVVTGERLEPGTVYRRLYVPQEW